MRILLIAFILLHGAAPVARAVESAALERGAAITDPATLRELDGEGFASTACCSLSVGGCSGFERRAVSPAVDDAGPEGD